MRSVTPLPPVLSGVIVQRLVEIDEALLYLISGAISGMVLKEPLEQTGTLTVEDAQIALSVALETYLNEEVSMPVIGSYMMLSVDDVPPKYLPCDGTEVSRTTYAELFAVIGTGFGAGNGTTTFNLPDWSFQSPMGMGLSQDGLVFLGVGGTYGEKDHTLINDEMPVHNHGVTDPGHIHAITDPGHFHDHIRAGGGAGSYTNVAGTTLSTPVNVAWPTQNKTTGITVNSHTTGVTVGNTGTGDAHNTVHPIQGVKMLIYAGV